MSKEAEYRELALSCADLAKSVSQSKNRLRLLVMAEAWRDLADRTARTPRCRPPADHPLVQKVFAERQNASRLSASRTEETQALATERFIRDA